MRSFGGSLLELQVARDFCGRVFVCRARVHVNRRVFVVEAKETRAVGCRPGSEPNLFSSEARGTDLALDLRLAAKVGVLVKDIEEPDVE
jgi:hypothetical protein